MTSFPLLRPFVRPFALALLLAGGGTIPAGILRATTYTWTGASGFGTGNYNWSIAGNWQGNAAPPVNGLFRTSRPVWATAAPASSIKAGAASPQTPPDFPWVPALAAARTP